MHGKKWHENEIDPTGWYISEKLDGIRAFWDGKHLFSKQGTIFSNKKDLHVIFMFCGNFLGKILSAPLEFLKIMPPNIPLDGELWYAFLFVFV